MQDYENAVRALEKCLADSDVTLVNEGWDPVSQQLMLLQYSAPGMPQHKLVKIADDCRAAHLEAIASRYEEEHPSLMATNLMRFVQSCLREKGVAVSGSEQSSTELLRIVPSTRREDLAHCVNNGVIKLYPGITAVGLS